MMMLSQRNKPLRCREVTGPTPHSVAVKAKFPSSRPHDYIILERRRKDDLREQMLAFIKENEYGDLRDKWELRTDHKILNNTVQRKVNDTIEEYRMQIEERRDRLKALLEIEELKYIQEMESMQETTLERQAKMRERARSLRERREKDRLALVAEKRDQQFREQCEELRALKSRVHQKEVCTERMAQLTMKEELERQRKEEEDLFAELWERDRLAKVENEERKTQRQMELNRELLDFLQAQRAAAEAQKMEEKRLKEEEAYLLAEQRKLMKMEDERALREKQQKQSRVRTMLDHSIRLKMKRLARDQQEELALDMKIMEQIMQDSHDDTEEKRQRKLELHKEQQIYRQYLAQQLEEEKRQEREMDKLIETELEKSWAKRAEQLRREKEARNRLMKDVMDTRRLQIQEKLEQNAREQEDLGRDKELLEKAMAEHKQLEMERNARKAQTAQQYQQQLLSQVACHHQVREAEKAEERREYENGLQAEKSYQQKLHDILSRPYVRQEHIHPLRRTRLSSPKDWLPQ
ncbi:PREDICTED: cilia- and flagella-associated protein 53 [Nanorana parkeri]|uniref:cilia- and flagella-associated protein 53 n=1 Tax=Nanorana parkeri TaxID=125878 RepID=UPI0008549474|nr:PREDICTED: cilia- and flagella-associated protein 53 [Nanorana parkeri]XP_018416511.1 PREDICTED: cilia- and flagella-associated protein 53 [Nanorana parkeri]